MEQNSLETLVKESVESLKFDLVKMHLSYGKSKDVLRVVISHPKKAIGADDCTLVADIISRRLDIDDPFTRPYDLVVESPGVEYEIKSFEEFRCFIGKDVKVLLSEKSSYVNSEGVLIGTLLEYKPSELVFEVIDSKQKVTISKDEIRKARLHCDFDKILKKIK